MLNLSSRYNLGLVWEDMADEIWKSVDKHQKIVLIRNKSDLEIAGILASAGCISEIDWIDITGADVLDISVNVINSVVKLVRSRIWLTNVLGWKAAMMEGAKCQLLLNEMEILAGDSPNHPITVTRWLLLNSVRGDLRGILGNMVRGDTEYDNHCNNGFSIWLGHIELSNVSPHLINGFAKNSKKEVRLGRP